MKLLFLLLYTATLSTSFSPRYHHCHPSPIFRPSILQTTPSDTPDTSTDSSADTSDAESGDGVVWSDVFKRDFKTLYSNGYVTSHPTSSDDDECVGLNEVDCVKLDGLGKLARRLARVMKTGGGGRVRPGVFRGYWREYGDTAMGEDEKVVQWRTRLTNIAGTKVGVENFYSYVTSKGDLEYMEGLVDMAMGVERKKGEEEMGKGEELLRRMKRRVSKKSAFETLVLLSVWSPHESIPLLSLSYPLFSPPSVLSSAQEYLSDPRPDVDFDLGIRRDLRRSKCYTIDGGGSEIDDAVGVEVEKGDGGEIKRRIWVHIADVERWCFGAPKEIMEHAKARGTSVYLPTGSIGMFPGGMQPALSLLAGRDTSALSMSLLMDDSGAIIEDSIEIMPSTVRVDYKLTYEEVDEMLAEGVGYREEWELGVLLQAAKLRRNYRIGRNATESLIDSPVPQGRVEVRMDRLCEQGVKVEVVCEEASYNSGTNGTAMGGNVETSDGRLLVTEMMIMAGEAMGKWCRKNGVDVPYRNQAPPHFKERTVERQFYRDLRENNVGDGWPASWYVRRFFEAVELGKEAKGHAGLGLDEYVQWSSPIRRFSDLQVHAKVKRHLRLKAIMESSSPLPASVTATDLGVHLSGVNDDVRGDLHDIDWNYGKKGAGEGKRVMKEISRYWTLEYLRRERPDRIFVTTVLGSIPNVYQPKNPAYAVLIEDLGFETVYKSELGELQIGSRLKLRISEVDPREQKVVWCVA